MTKKIRIGTRGSRLALVQAHTVAAQLQAAHPGLQVEIIEIKTSGEWKPEQGETRLSEAAGGKGLFAKEIEQALLDGRIDCGVHSMKDMPSFLPEGLEISHVLEREDPRDAFLSNDHGCLADVPPGAVVGTASMRRQAIVLARRPDLTVVPLRGNVPTRIAKLRSGQVDVAILAAAGLRRLELIKEAAYVIEPEEMLPAAGQGVIGLEIRCDDAQARALIDPLDCPETGRCVEAERAVLQVLDGSCHTPIGAYAVADGDEIYLRALVAAPDGHALYEDERRAPAPDRQSARALGQELGQALKARLPEGFLL